MWGCGISRRAVALFSLFLFSASNELARADIRIGQDADEVVVEASDFDCRLPNREEDFVKATDKFVDLVNQLKARFPGPWSDLSRTSDEEVRSVLRNTIREFYAAQYAHNHGPQTPLTPTDLPRPTGMVDSLRLPSGQVLVPSATWISISRRVLGGTTSSPNAAVNAAEAALRTARNPMSASNITGGISVQFGLLAAPLCRSRIDLNAREARVRTERGWDGLSWDFEPFVMVYARGGVGEDIGSTNTNWLQKWRPSVGIVWGDLDQAADISGGFFNGGFDYNFRLPFSRLGERWRNWGFNWKTGCISNPSLEGTISIPYCKNFVFASWRPRLIDAVPGDRNWSFTFNSAAEGGVMLTGAPAIRMLLTMLNYPPEKIDETLQGLSWLVDVPIQYKPPGAPGTRVPAANPTPSR